VDQRDFNREAGLPPKKKEVVVVPAPQVPALVTIRYTEPNPPYQDALTRAVHAALSRKPSAIFDVSTVVPQSDTAADSADLAARAAQSGREVAQTIVDAGAVPSQVEQVVSIDPGAKVREVVVRVQ
jgi:predicted methyltransferase